MCRFFNFLAILVFASFACCFANHPGLDVAFAGGNVSSATTPGFGMREWWTRNNRGMSSHAHTDGRLTVAAYQWGSFAIARFLANGQIDPTFNAGNAKVVSIGNEIASAFGVDSQGRVIVTAYPYDTFSTRVIVYRFTSTGAIDPAFGIDGRKETTLPVVVASNSVVPAGSRNVIARATGGFFVMLEQAAVVAFTDGGEIDGALWNNGVYYAPTLLVGSNASMQARIVASDHLGNLFVMMPTQPFVGFSLKKVTQNGASDPAFNSPIFDTTFSSARVDVSGRVVGLVDTGLLPSLIKLVRLTADGTLDTSFGTAGTVTEPNFQQQILSDVSVTGEIVVTNVYSFEPSAAKAAFIVFDASGQRKTSFGGRGLTRFEPGNFGEAGFLAEGAVFSSAGDGLYAFGIPYAGNAINAVRTHLSFTHQFSIDNVSTLPLNPKYGDGLSVLFRVNGDQGNVSGTLSLQFNGVNVCTESMYRTYANPNRDYGCGGSADAGDVATEIVFSGDHLYLPRTFAGPTQTIARNQIQVRLFANPNQPQLPKDRFTIGLVASANSSFGYILSGVPVRGDFEITDGVSSCLIPADIYLNFPAPICALVLKSPGTKRIYVRHLGDSNFREETVGETSVTVVSAISELTLQDEVSGLRNVVSIETGDPHCGLKYGWAAYVDDSIAEVGAERAHARSGGMFVSSVSDCSTGFSGSLTVRAENPQEILTSAWARNEVGGWTEYVGSGGRAVVPFQDGATSDTAVPNISGNIGVLLIPSIAARDSKCVFDAYEGITPSHGLALLRFALGFEGSMIFSGLGPNSWLISRWLERVTCTSCSSELDISGDGRFDMNDATVILRRLRGQLSTQFVGLIPTSVPAGSTLRDTVRAASFINSGCRTTVP
jgi:uncharacterized delta-60 repeat protein